MAYDTLFTFDRKLLVQANQNMKETSFLMFEEKPKSRKLNLEFKDYRININLISHDGNLNDYLNNFWLFSWTISVGLFHQTEYLEIFTIECDAMWNELFLFISMPRLHFLYPWTNQICWINIMDKHSQRMYYLSYILWKHL